MNGRIIFHIDMDAFFASIEIIHNPALRGKPVVVGGNPDSRGVVSTCSYEARAYGIHSAMSLFEAKKRCPHAIFIQGSYHLYRDYSDLVMAILQRYTPYVEVVSVDEAYLDVTETAKNYGGPKSLAEIIKKKVLEETGLPCSIGIASNKLVAKISSGLAKPNGLYEIPEGEEAAFLAPLPIQTLLGIGIKTQEVLNRDGLKSIKDLQSLDMDELIKRYGMRGYHFYHESRGHDNRPVVWEETLPKSIGAETTFDKDLGDMELLKEALKELTERACKRLKNHKMRARGVSIKVRFGDFRTINRSHTFYNHTNNLDKIWTGVVELFERTYDGVSPLRLVGVSLEKLTDGYWQPTFWD